VRRRKHDPEDADFRDDRSFLPRALNGHTKWVVSVVSALLILALVSVVGSDWKDTKATSRRNETNIAVIQSKLSQIQVSLEEIKHAVERRD